MVVIQCIDNRGGTAFNARRQSQDQLLRARVRAKLRGRRLWMNAYSRRQFQKDLPPEFPISVDEDFLARAGTGDVCFVEGLPLSPWLDRIEAVVLYRWNRDYPADAYLDLDLGVPPWRLASRAEFPGSSHPTITEEVYIP